MYPFVISLRNLRLARGAKVLIESATLQIHPGWKVGLTGANGSGKSSLFAMLRDQLHPDQGDLDMPPGWVIAHVAQETPALERAAIDYALDGDRELRRIEQDLAAAEAGLREMAGIDGDLVIVDNDSGDGSFEALQAGDVVEVLAGEVVPADGRIVRGASSRKG